jgi:MoCo/4Fe-4S cofactor protein with predicted Tat translocation signal
MSAAKESAPGIWRSLDELADTPEFRDFTAKEFPGFANVYEELGEAELLADPQSPALNRRQFVALSAAAMGLAGLSGCRRPELPILPYSQTPDFVIPGLPLYFATSMPRPGGCFPILVESHEGRPTKIEGHPQHPASLGASDAFAQASILDLYSPDRSPDVLHKGKVKSWEEFDLFAAVHFADLKKKQGEGLRFLIEDNPSPALRLLREHIKEKFPQAVWHVYEPIGGGNSLAGTKIATGHALVVSPRFERALRVLSLDCDFLGLDGDSVRNGQGFAERRRIFAVVRYGNDLASSVNRLYVLENTYTVTGALADHRLRIPAAHVIDYAVGLAREIAVQKGVTFPPALKAALDKAPAPGVIIPEAGLREVAADLAAFPGRSLIVAGERQPPLVHALTCFLNDALKNTGSTVEYRPAVAEENQSIEELAKAIVETKVKSLVIIGGNPAFNAPADIGFGVALETVPTVIRLGMFLDETSEKSTWRLPLAHYLEAWGDAETADGTYSMIQPLIAPLHRGRSALEFLILISNFDKAASYDDAKTKAYALVKMAFAKRTGKEDELSFKRFIHEGFAPDSARPAVKPALNAQAIADAVAKYVPPQTVSASNLEVSFHADSSLLDGRFAWNGWLLELPNPISKLVWDNAALVSPRTAAYLRVQTGDLLRITAAGPASVTPAITANRSITIPAFILPGQADHTISLMLGYGKLRPSRVEGGGGFDVYPIRTTHGLHFNRVVVAKTAERYDLVATQEHGTIPTDKENDIIRDYALDDYLERSRDSAENPEKAHAEDDPRTRFQWGYDVSDYKDAGPAMKDIKRIALQTADDLSFPQRLNGAMQWGMVIDLNTCTGCSACVVACQAENNIPIVGKGEVKLHREMHWISLHRYFMQAKGPVRGGLEQSPADDPSIVAQPMMCQQCEAAPCESVCPVNAAVHSPEGLNLQVYNRCIGTRYCSNNCPYKARRFNWFDFNKRRPDQLRVPTPFSEAGMPETLKMQKNPEVTVRMRGVMEKCTYCVQRIERAKIGAKVLAIKAGDDKADTPATTDSNQEYRQGYAVRQLDGVSQIIVPDGIIKTACAQACPTGAIVFGNVRDQSSRVHQLKNLKYAPDYLVLGSLNTKPRTSYLPRLRNLNPRMHQQEESS